MSSESWPFVCSVSAGTHPYALGVQQGDDGGAELAQHAGLVRLGQDAGLHLLIQLRPHGLCDRGRERIRTEGLCLGAAGRGRAAPADEPIRLAVAPCAVHHLLIDRIVVRLYQRLTDHALLSPSVVAMSFMKYGVCVVTVPVPDVPAAARASAYLNEPRENRRRWTRAATSFVATRVSPARCSPPTG